MKRRISFWRLICITAVLSLCIFMFAGCGGGAGGGGEGVKEDPPEAQTEETEQAEPKEKPPADAELFDEFADELFTTWVSEDDISLNYSLSDPAAYGVEAPPVPTFGKVGNKEYLEEGNKENKELTDRLKGFTYSELRPDQQITYDILMRSLELSKTLMGNEAGILYYLSDISPVRGLQMQLPTMLAEYHFYTSSDIDRYLLLLEDTGRLFDELIEIEYERAERGLMLEAHDVDSIIKMCEDFLKEREENLLIAVFDDKIDNYDGLTEEQREEYKEKNHELIISSVLPAYEALQKAMEELRGEGVRPSTMLALHDGFEFTQAYLQHRTGSDKTIEEMGYLLMEALFDTDERLMILLDSYEELYDKYMDNKLGEIPEDTPENYLRKLEIAIKKDFPSGVFLDYTVREVHESMQEAESVAFYLTPPIDSYYDNVIYKNPSKIYDNLSLFTTLAHEGYPGHMYQMVYNLQSSPPPLRTELWPAGYVEGWATYVEMESYYYAGLDVLEAEAAQQLNLHYLLFQGWIDLGINGIGWDMETLAKACEMVLGITDSSVVEEIFNSVTGDPFLSMPYALGYLEFLSLRDEAKESLGNDFVLMEFHRFILDFGPAPFELIRSHMQEWIEGQSGEYADAA
ncbi:MAG: DUF885 family protein [Clostridiales bacterium]|nr:DUF885 family protein [Clostridiales bacterium]